MLAADLQEELSEWMRDARCDRAAVPVSHCAFFWMHMTRAQQCSATEKKKQQQQQARKDNELGIQLITSVGFLHVILWIPHTRKQFGIFAGVLQSPTWMSCITCPLVSIWRDQITPTSNTVIWRPSQEDLKCSQCGCDDTQEQSCLAKLTCWWKAELVRRLLAVRAANVACLDTFDHYYNHFYVRLLSRSRRGGNESHLIAIKIWCKTAKIILFCLQRKGWFYV